MVILIYTMIEGGDIMIQVKSTDVKIRGSEKDIIIEGSVLMRYLFNNDPWVFREILDCVRKEIEARDDKL